MEAIKRTCNKIILGILFLFEIIPGAVSQNQADNWLFKNFGLEFLQDTVLVRKDYPAHNTGVNAAISDKNGHLLFYTDGESVWCRDHTLMPNGSKIYSGTTSVLPTQTVIIPKPGSDSIYYIVSVSIKAGLYYSTVNIKLNNGLGDVQEKGRFLQNLSSNKLTAVFHQNRRDVWLLTHQTMTNNFFAFLLSNAGITVNPVNSLVGPNIASGNTSQLKASPDGTKVALSYQFSSNKDDLTLFDFDNATGFLTNPRIFTLPATIRGGVGVEFSSDGTKLYANQSGSTGESGLYQFDLVGKTTSEIDKSRVFLFGEHYNQLTYMQLAPDGRIYITKGGGGGGTEHLAVIEHPNEYGLQCDAKENAFYLQGFDGFSDVPPLFIQNYFFRTSFTIENTCLGSVTECKVTNLDRLDSVKWDFGNGKKSNQLNPKIRYSDAGTFTITLFAYYPEKVDTIPKVLTINPSSVFDLGVDRTVCSGYDLMVPEGFVSYKWSTGDSTRSIYVTNSGAYSVSVENNYGCIVSDTVKLTMAEMPVINLNDTILMVGDSVRLYPGVFKTYRWSTGDTTSYLTLKDEGWFTLSVENEFGCKALKTFFICRAKFVLPDDLKGWTLLNPKPTARNCRDIVFLDGQTGFILTEMQLLRTTDCGNTWSILSQITSGNHLAFKNGIGFVVGNAGAIFKSTYMGGGWKKLNPPITDDLNAVTMISTDTILVTSAQNLYYSYDGGSTWSLRSITTKQVYHSLFTSTKVGLVGCSDGTILKTVDGGITWYTTSSVNYSPAEITKIYFYDKKMGFASRGYYDILKTTDGGESWFPVSNTTDHINSYFFLSPSLGYIAGEYGVIFKTVNGAATFDWLGFQSGRYGGTDLHGLYFLDETIGFAVGNGGRIMKTTNGGNNWIEYASTYKPINQLKFVTDQVGYGVIENKFIKTTDGGNNWIILGSPGFDVTTNRYDFVNSEVGYCIAGGSMGTSATVAKVYKTIDGGKSWVKTNKGLDIMIDDLNSIDFIDQDTGYVSGGFNYDNTFKTIDGGNTWTNIGKFSFSQIQFANAQTGYARTYDKIYKTTDSGRNWTLIFLVGNYEDEIYDITSMHFLSENIGFVVGDNSLMYKTNNGGVSWEKVAVPYGYYIDVKFLSPNIGFIMTDYGLYTTLNGGANWEEVMRPYYLTKMELFGKNVYLYGPWGVILKKRIEFEPVDIQLDAASEITINSAHVSGTVAVNAGHLTDLAIEYGIGTINNKLALNTTSVSVDSSQKISVELSNLKPQSTYSCQLTANCDGTPYRSKIMQFTTLPEFILTMNYVDSISANDAVLNGYITANGDEINDVEFQYGTDMKFGNSVQAAPNLVPGKSAMSVRGKLTSLKPKTQYLARLKATYKDSTIYSGLTVFSTRPEFLITVYSPSVIGQEVSLEVKVSAYKETIRDAVFVYGKTTDYTHQMSAIPDSVEKNSYQYLNVKLSGLDSTAIYHYKFKARMGDSVITSSDGIFKIKSMVQIEPPVISQLSDSTLHLEAKILPDGLVLQLIRFQYGLTMNYGSYIYATPYYVYGFNTNTVRSDLQNLIPGSIYHFRILATDGSNMYYSNDVVYTMKSTDIGTDATSGISLYPNPCENIVHIQVSETIQRIEVFDSFGKRVFLGASVKSIDFSAFPKGLYIVKISFEKQQVIRKIIKN